MTTLKDMFAKAVSEREMRHDPQNTKVQEWANRCKPYILKELERMRDDVKVLLEDYVDTKNAVVNDAMIGHGITLFDEGQTGSSFYWPISLSCSTAELEAMRKAWKTMFSECFFQVYGVPCNIHQRSNYVTVSVSVKHLV